MDIAQLKQLVKAGLQGGKYALNTATLESGSINAIATGYLPDATLQVVPDPNTPIIEPPDGTSIIVKGAGIDTPFKGMPLEATFYIGSTGEAAVSLAATGDENWTLDKSFGVFANNIGASLRFKGGAEAPVLSLLSDAQGDLPVGLSLSGVINFSAMTTGVSTLLGITTEAVSGPIVLSNGAGEFVSLALTGPDLTNVNLWVVNDVQMTFLIGNQTINNPITNTNKPIPYVQLGTAIPFSASGSANTIPITVQVTNWTSPIRFDADISQAINAALADLSQLVNGADLSKTLPPPSSFPVENILQFTDLYLEIDPSGKSISEIGLQVKSTAPWTIVHIQSTDKTIVAEDIQLNFSVVTPFSSPSPYLNLGGGVQLTPTAELFVSASFPQFEVLGYLTEGSVLSIQEFIEQFVGPCSGIPDLSIDVLYFDLMAGDYTFEIDIIGYWPINPDQSVLLIVEQLGFSVSYSASVLTANFTGMLRVASVDILITADYTTGDGWLFAGKTGDGQVIPIGDFLTYVTNQFGIPPPPAWMQSITLQDLHTSLNTKTKDFTFGVTANATISDKPCQLVINFALTHDPDDSSYSLVLSGILTVADTQFELDFEKNGTDTLMAATWKETGANTLNLVDIANLFGDSTLTDILGDIPPSMDLALESASFTYDFTNNELVLTAVSKNYGALVFVAAKINNTWVFVFLVAISKIDLTKLPLVGEDIGKLGKFEVDDLNLLVCSGTMSKTTIGQINTLIQAAATREGATLPQLPDGEAGLQQGVNLSMTFEAPGWTTPVQVGTATASNGGGGNALLLPAKSPKASGPVLILAGDNGSNVKTQNGYWINIKKSIGPVYMEKVGINYSKGDLEFLFNFSLTLGPLSVTFDGLMVGSPLSAFDPVFGLQGLSITFNSGPVAISGGFIRVELDGITEYNGEALIKAADFSLSAMGSYAKVDGQTSLFIFALINAPLGGPPYLFITGVAAGFGYNRGLKIPGIDQVSSFPLTSGFVPGQSSPFSSPDPGQALQVLVSDNVVPIRIGEDWLSAGISFTSFEMLQSYALLVVEFGATLEIALLGMTTASIPTGDPRPLVFAQLALEVRILPDEGLIAVDAKLSPSSYLLATSCHLTGGFAFYVWFGNNAHAGDFVVTLGGYHPNFTPPDYYPQVPRLGFNWIVTSELTIKGGMYFALTPSCLMAGGALEATWQSGNLKAWFDVGANFLIAWKPYHYEAEVYLNFGVSYTFKVNLLFATITKTISVSLGADLSIWGPSFSGEAKIHLWIISFTIHFGSDSSQKPPPISWAEFEASFFPKSGAAKQPAPFMAASAFVQDDPPPIDLLVCWAKVQSGLVRDLSPGPDNPDDLSWIIQAHGSVIEADTQIPAKTFSISIKGSDGVSVDPSNIIFTNQDALDGINTDFGVGPVAVEHDDFLSDLSVEIVYEDGKFSSEQVFYITALIQDVPKALWINQAPGLSNETLLSGVLTGFQISSGEITPDQTPWVDMKWLEDKNLDYAPLLSWSDPQPVSGPAQPADPIVVLEQTIADSANRSAILSVLAGSGFAIDTDVDLSHMAQEAGDFLLAEPVFAYEYWKV